MTTSTERCPEHGIADCGFRGPCGDRSFLAPVAQAVAESNQQVPRRRPCRSWCSSRTGSGSCDCRSLEWVHCACGCGGYERPTPPCICQGHPHDALADRHPAPNGYCMQCPCTRTPEAPDA